MSAIAAARPCRERHMLLSCCPLPLASAQAMDVPIGCTECQPGPNPIGFRLTNDLGSSPGQLVACAVEVVHFEQGHDAGAVAPVELEIAVAWAEQLDPVIVFRRQLYGAGLVEGHRQAQGLGEEPDRSRVVAGGDAKPDQTSNPHDTPGSHELHPAARTSWQLVVLMPPATRQRAFRFTLRNVRRPEGRAY